MFGVGARNAVGGHGTASPGGEKPAYLSGRQEKIHKYTVKYYM
jgi:hypothetical protein